MKSALIALGACAALAGLSGCVAYGGDPYAGYNNGYGYPYGSSYYGYGQPAYGYGQPAYAYPYPPGVVQGTIVYESQPQRRGDRDRDGDGIPNRVDRDRDGDGVPNRYDARPNNPRYR